MSKLETALSALEARLKAKNRKPLSAMTNIDVHNAVKFDITCAELKALCAKFPDHPHTEVFMKAIEGYNDDKIVTVDEVDIKAMYQNTTVDHVRTIPEDGGDPTVTKVLGEKVVAKKEVPEETPEDDFTTA